MKNTYLTTGMYFTSDGIRNCYIDKYKQNNHISEFYIDKYHGKYDLIYSYTIKDVTQLILSFIVKRLHVGDLVDVLDTNNCWYLSCIEGIKNNKIWIHYLSWSTKWDEWISIPSDKIKLDCQMVPGLSTGHITSYIHNSTISRYSEFNIIYIDKQIYNKIHPREFLSTITYSSNGVLKFILGYFRMHSNYIIKVNYKIKIIKQRI